MSSIHIKNVPIEDVKRIIKKHAATIYRNITLPPGRLEFLEAFSKILSLTGNELDAQFANEMISYYSYDANVIYIFNKNNICSLYAEWMNEDAAEALSDRFANWFPKGSVLLAYTASDYIVFEICAGAGTALAVTAFRSGDEAYYANENDVADFMETDSPYIRNRFNNKVFTFSSCDELLKGTLEPRYLWDFEEAKPYCEAFRFRNIRAAKNENQDNK